jgi:hypothetical protein
LYFVQLYRDKKVVGVFIAFFVRRFIGSTAHAFMKRLDVFGCDSLNPRTGCLQAAAAMLTVGNSNMRRLPGVWQHW